MGAGRAVAWQASVASVGAHLQVTQAWEGVARE